jgi:hypothetical protein
MRLCISYCDREIKLRQEVFDYFHGQINLQRLETIVGIFLNFRLYLLDSRSI